jgi:acyl-CoA thioesterase
MPRPAVPFIAGGHLIAHSIVAGTATVADTSYMHSYHVHFFARGNNYAQKINVCLRIRRQESSR